ncbi:VOC family protein [Sinorhizobium meliloti]|uniref:VOC family protein n=1 Tax=Rhizobium meliloti TaxID=382 RepID=UPI0030B9C6B9
MGVGISFFILRTKFLTQAFKRIAEHVGLIQRGQAQFWGQRVFRFFDPDGTVIAWAKKVSRAVCI